jgi:hypothetical protein
MIPRRSIPRDRQALSTKAKANIIFAKAIERALPRLSKRSMVGRWWERRVLTQGRLRASGPTEFTRTAGLRSRVLAQPARQVSSIYLLARLAALDNTCRAEGIRLPIVFRKATLISLR